MSLRITPAGAGKTVKIHNSECKPQDHPRRCGENVYVFPCVRNKPGSPPQVRGKPLLAVKRKRYMRITPAGAGKTRLNGANRNCRWDHPRRCGENSVHHIRGCDRQGSPPQVRGKLNRDEPAADLTGITPAGAGKTRRRTIANTCPEDHPRRCGENIIRISFIGFGLGSPPQVRGKHGCA